MAELFGWIADQITTAISGNDFFAGGLLLAVLGVVSGFAYRVIGPAKKLLKRRYTITIEIREREPFLWMAEWLAIEAAKRKCRLLSVSEDNAYKPGEYDDALASKAMFVPGHGAHLFWKDGRPVWVRRSLEEASHSIDGFAFKVDTINLTTLGGDPTPLRELVLIAERAYRERRNHNLSVWCEDGYGGWDERELQTGRPIESVILKGDDAEVVCADVIEFFANRDRYLKVGAPYRRGYLLHGPPGCGKTSLAKALATEAGVDLYILTVSSSTMTDDKLLRRMSNVKPRSMVILEDVDAAFNGRQKDGEGITFSGLLNAIDGIVSPEGRVLIMTTNHREELDPALVRPGRADIHLLLEEADSDMAARLFLRFFPGMDVDARIFGRQASGASPAAIQTHLFDHWDDAQGAINAWRGDLKVVESG